jgi:hypothetical protein
MGKVSVPVLLPTAEDPWAGAAVRLDPGREKNMKLTATVMTILVASSGAQAGSCEKAKADYARQVAEDAAVSEWWPGVKEANDRINKRMKGQHPQGLRAGRLLRSTGRGHQAGQGEVRGPAEHSRLLRPLHLA